MCKWGQTPITLKRDGATFVATVSRGEPRTLAHPESDTSLDIPRNTPGFYQMGVYIEHAILREKIPVKECLASPLIELCYKKLSKKLKVIQQQAIYKEHRK